MIESSYSFAPQRYEDELLALIAELDGLGSWDQAAYERALRHHPKDGRGFFSKAEILAGFRHLNRKLAWQRDDQVFADKIRMKPVRTLSGVAPVTVLTRPYPCPGRCIFCPSDVRMPKSYLSEEPGAQRAAEHQFDPYRQTFSRLRALSNIGHRVDKVELIVLGGTWSYYHESYQVWFVKRCFDAMNDFGSWRRGEPIEWPEQPQLDFRTLEARVDGADEGGKGDQRYNRIVTSFAAGADGLDRQSATWEELGAVQADNETALARCVGLVVETRPDHLDLAEAVRIRRLGATKVQIGFQSLDDDVLRLNRRGHDVDATRRAVRLLRQMGFKIHAHWMPNLYGSNPQADISDYRLLFDDPDFRPDELKVYPCSLIESAELMRFYRSGDWRPYSHDELLEVLTVSLAQTPPYCRLTRVIRDIPGTDIVDGNKLTNFRELVEREIGRRGQTLSDIRAREIGSREVSRDELRLDRIEYATSSGREIFLQYVDPRDRLAAFLRLSLPDEPPPIEEIAASAMIREVHVYGRLVAIGGRDEGRSQHLGLGRSLIEHAASEAARGGFADLAVISSVGTRGYYRALEFSDGDLYQHRPTRRSAATTGAGMPADVGEGLPPSRVPTSLAALDQLDVDLDLDVLADHQATGFEQPIVGQAELGAVDGQSTAHAETCVAPGILDGAGDVDRHANRLGGPLDGQVTDSHQLIAIPLDRGTAEADLGVVLDIEEVRAAEIFVPTLVAGVDRGRDDHHLDRRTGQILQIDIG